MLPYISCLAGRSGTANNFAALDILEALEEYFLEPMLVISFFAGQDVCSRSTITLGSSF